MATYPYVSGLVDVVDVAVPWLGGISARFFMILVLGLMVGSVLAAELGGTIKGNPMLRSLLEYLGNFEFGNTAEKRPTKQRLRQRGAN